MKIALLNDTHAGVRNSSDIFIKYQERFYSEVFFPYLEKHGIKNILHGGDYYEHRKYINFKALHANRKHFLEPMREAGITMDIIAGNHDVFYKSTNDLCALKELLGYYTDCVNIIMKPRVLEYGSAKIAMLPWINSENYTSSLSFIKKAKADMLLGHLELEGFEMMRGIKNPHGMKASIFKNFSMVLSGHFHTKSTQGNVHYLGSQMEFTWSDCEDPKYFHVYDTETKTLEAIRNPITMFEKIHYDDTKFDYSKLNLDQFKEKYIKVYTVRKTDAKMYDDFIDSLNAIGAYEVRITDTMEEFSGDAVDDEGIVLTDTKDLLSSYVDSVSTDLDKDIIKSDLHSLFTEAQNQGVV